MTSYLTCVIKKILIINYAQTRNLMSRNIHLHTHQKRRGDKIYHYYSLAEAYREKGKNKRRILTNLGTLSDEERIRIKSICKALSNPKAFVTTRDDLFIEKNYRYLDCAVINYFWDFWSLSDIFPANSRKDIQTDHMARIFTINKCLDPGSKIKISKWYRETALEYILGIPFSKINKGRIFRELEEIEKKKEALSKHLFHRIRNLDSSHIIFYDLTSGTITGKKCSLAKFGHCKEGFKLHIVLSLIISHQGYPFYWEVMEGNTADVTTIKRLIEKVKREFNLKEITLVFDRGMVSESNLNQIEEERLKYISALDKDQIATFREIKPSLLEPFNCENIFKEVEEVLSKDGFSKYDDTLYYRELRLKDEKRFILCFNPFLFYQERKARQKKIEKGLSFIEKKNRELLLAKKSRGYESTKRVIDRQIEKMGLKKLLLIDSLEPIMIRQEPSPEKLKFVHSFKIIPWIDEEHRKEIQTVDGLWILVTNHYEKEQDQFKMEPKKLIRPYREKNRIEEAFKNLKSFIEVEPFYVYLPLSIKAHYTICVLSYLMNISLVNMVKQNKPLREMFKSSESIHQALSICLVNEILIKSMHIKTRRITTPTELQLELLKVLECEHLVTKSHLRSIGIR